MTARLVVTCELCDAPLERVLSLGASPPACAMPTAAAPTAVECHYPLDLLFCDACAHGQLSVVVDPSLVFPPDYPYASGNSRALHDNFRDLAGHVGNYLGGLGPDDLVVDVGANDGTLLRNFPACRTVGVEPTRQAQRITGPHYRESFTSGLARRIIDQHGQARVITACNVLAHVDQLDDVMTGIRTLLRPDGVFIAENHDLETLVHGGQWDAIYHEHLRYYSVHSFHRLLQRHDLNARWWTGTGTHGGSFRIASRPGRDSSRMTRPEYDFRSLARSARDARARLRAAAAGGVYGIGATARATTIINYCGLDVEDVECVCEVPGSDKIGRLIPGTRIPVLSEERLFDDNQPDKTVLFSWHLADAIIPKLRKRGYEGEIVTPLSALAYP